MGWVGQGRTGVEWLEINPLLLGNGATLETKGTKAILRSCTTVSVLSLVIHSGLCSTR